MIPDDLGPMTPVERALHEADSTPDPPRGDNYAKLCMGEQVTICCGAFATFDVPEDPEDAVLCCKICWNEVGLGRDG